MMYEGSRSCFHDGGYNTLPLSAQLGYFVPLDDLYCTGSPPQRRRPTRASSFRTPRTSRKTLR